MADDKSLSLEDRIAKLEAKAGKHRKSPELPPQPSLVELNRRSLEIQRGRRIEKKSALGVAKEALEKAFQTTPGKRVERRTQKDVAPHGAEMTATATKKDAK